MADEIITQEKPAFSDPIDDMGIGDDESGRYYDEFGQPITEEEAATLPYIYDDTGTPIGDGADLRGESQGEQSIDDDTESVEEAPVEESPTELTPEVPPVEPSIETTPYVSQPTQVAIHPSAQVGQPQFLLHNLSQRSSTTVEPHSVGSMDGNLSKTQHEVATDILTSKGAIALYQGKIRQGTELKSVWYIIRYPYKSEKDAYKIVGDLPRGIVPIMKADGLSYNAIHLLTGIPPNRLSLDLGVQDILVTHEGGGKMKATYFHNPRRKTKGDIDLKRVATVRL
jgi:hypothetical protein